MVFGASALAKKYNVSDLVIGLTIVSFGTSAPELVVNSVASIQNHSDIVFGNVLGSNIVNLFLILGITGLVYPITVQSNTVWKEIPISLLAVVLLYVLSNGFLFQEKPVVTWIDGGILLAMFAAFMVYIYSQMKSDRIEIRNPEFGTMSNFKIWGLIVIGIAGLVLGGKLVVDNAIKVATVLGVSEKVIGLTIVAIGTSLPELVTSVVAALKKNSDIAFGNIIGSNIFNILLIVSVSSFINPIYFNVSFNTEMYLLAGGTLVLFIAMFTGGRKKLDRWEAAILLIVYLVYTSRLIFKEI
ncbi:calcium/sodium antiporter [Draconibacterium sp.]